MVVLLREPSRHSHRLDNLKGTTAADDLANQHKGMISQNAKRKMIDAILWLNASAQWKWSFSKNSGKWFRWKLNFIHLTLPSQGQHSDKFIKHLLHKFFLYAFRKTGLRSYVWKAEPQERGEIHFHITSDTFIWKTTLQNIWNGILREHGCLGTHENPPSTKVHPTHNIREMTSYLIKYMTKNDQHRRIISGRLWGCSRNLSSAKNIFFTLNENEAVNEFNSVKSLPQDVRYYDYCSVKYTAPTFFEALPECELRKKYYAKIKEIRFGKAEDEFSFFNENGEPITFAQAKKVGLPKPQQEIFKLQQWQASLQLN